jgi:hypothetical protein
MVLSKWRLTWQGDFDGILHSMSKQERAGLQRWGLVSVQGRRIFLFAAKRLGLDITYSAYVMEQAALVLNHCRTCSGPVESLRGIHLTVWTPARFEESDFTDLHFCSEACLRASTLKFAQTGSWPESPSLTPV